MGAVGTMMAFQTADTLGQFALQRKNANALISQGVYTKSRYDYNAGIADIQAADATRRGTLDANNLNSQTRQLAGSQRATLAASGVDVNSGTAAAIVDETYILGERDATTIRNNAALEAFGFQTQAADLRQQGAMAADAANQNARTLRQEGWNTLMTGAAQNYGIYRSFSTPTSVKPKPEPSAYRTPLQRDAMARGKRGSY